MHQPSSIERVPSPLSGRRVLAYLVGFFAVVAAANGFLIGAAIMGFGGLATESSYQAGLSFARDVAAAQSQDARHWQVDAKVTALPDHAVRIEIEARGIDRELLSGLHADASLVHPVNRNMDRALVLASDVPGHFVAITGPASGQWDLVIDLARHGERLFRSKNRVVLR
jgi:nitrogen fixation protein FixH